MVRTRVGYAGGLTARPTYRSMGDHTETFQMDFDPAVLSYAEILDRFWSLHDPFDQHRSPQYQCALFHGDEEQRRLALERRDRVAGGIRRPILTRIEPLAAFHRAEDYHQKFYLRRHAELMTAFGAYSASEFVDSTVAARLNGYVAGFGSNGDLEAELPRWGLPDRAADGLRDLVGRASAFRCG